ncbi:hypothetical protein LINGRAHAP2_LOCUS9774 [Linum grandiflorum]
MIDHIHSFLDTKLLVQASVLSKRWKCTWKQVYVLRFHSPSFRSYSNFKRYVGKVLVFSFHSPLDLCEFILIVMILEKNLQSDFIQSLKDKHI